MKWNTVGKWLKANAGSGTALVGSLLTGNVPAAVAAGVSLVSGATGTNDPEEVLAQLQGNSDAMVKLKELTLKDEESVRKHIEEMARLEFEDEQHSHTETQNTIRNGDNATDKFVRWCRPGQSWVSLFAALFYALSSVSPDVMILGALLTLPWAYAGLRQVGKGIDSFTSKITKK